MKAHYHFHIQNFVNISGETNKKEVDELIKLINHHKTSESLIKKSVFSIKKGLMNAFASECVIKITHLLKMIKL